MPERYHVLIVGGGPGGAATAIQCAQAGLRGMLIEREPFPREHPGETLHPGVEPLLRQLGVEKEILAAGFLRHEGNWVQWGGSLQFMPFGRDEEGSWRGFQAWRASFDTILLNHARQLGTSILQPCRALRPHVEAHRAAGIVTADGLIQAPFVVDAAGPQHWLARHLGLKVKTLTPRLIAWYGYAKGWEPHRDDAPALVADAAGWTWTAQVQTGVYQWTRLSFSNDRIKQDWLPEEFRSLSRRGPTRGADVTWRLASPIAGKGYFLVGDAAAVLDPASSHGVLRALVSGMLAGQLMARIIKEGLQETVAVREYSQWLRKWFLHDVERLRELYAIFSPARKWAVNGRR